MSELQDALKEVAVETVYHLVDGSAFAFEGVTPNCSEESEKAIEERLYQAFDVVRKQRFNNSLGLSSVFWRAWVDSLPFSSITFDGKMTTGRIYLDEPDWRECGAMNTQRPEGFERNPKPKKDGEGA